MKHIKTSTHDRMARLIFESLVSTPQGLDLSPGKHKTITTELVNCAERNDPAGAQAFYETIGILKLTNAHAAASSLTKLMANITGQLQEAQRSGWSARL